jgi:putative DNA primase/helicase
MNFISGIFNNDQATMDFVRRAVGYSLTGSVAEQCMFILIGTGANGKSTFLRTLHHLFGDYAGSVPIQTLMTQKNGSQQTNDLAYSGTDDAIWRRGAGSTIGRTSSF